VLIKLQEFKKNSSIKFVKFTPQMSKINSFLFQILTRTIPDYL